MVSSVSHPYREQVPADGGRDVERYLDAEVFPLARLKSLSPILLCLLAAIAFFSLAWVGIWITREAGRVASIWLANAALLSLLLSTDRRIWPAMLVSALAANIAANLSAGDSLPIALILSLCNSFEVAASAYLITRFRPKIDLSRRADLVLFFTIAAVCAPSATAVAAAAALSVLADAPFLAVLGNWFAADSLGMLVLPPLLLGSYPSLGKQTFFEQILRPTSLLLLLLVCTVTTLVFAQNTYPFLFFVIPPLVLAAFYVGFAGAAMSILLVAAISIFFTIHGRGPIVLVDASLPIRIFFLQTFLATCVFITLVVAANIADRQRLLRTLRIHMEATERANRAKSEFLSTVSHELRTPLTSIRGSLGLIAAGVTGQLPPKVSNLVKIAYTNSERLVRLINDILDMEKIESGKMIFVMRQMPIRTMVEQVIAANVDFMPDRGIRIVLVDDAPRAEANVDPDRLNQVFANLLSNAIKFSPVGGTVTVTLARRRGNFIRVSVADRGAGIPEPFRKRMFGKFEQSDASNTREKGGTGLGLSIAKSIVEKLGGTIGFETEDGKGTDFHVDLPEVAPAEIRAAGPAASPANSDRRDRVLICEDESDISAVIAALLDASGFASDVAPDIASAKTLLETRDYVALTLDIKLAGESGIKLFQDVRASPANADVPVIVISAVADETKRSLNGSALGITDWLEKPVDPERLHAALAKIVARKVDRRPRVLHVEDDDGVLEVMSEGLGSDVSITFARTVREARDAISNHRFDLMILDIALPDGSGLDLLSNLPVETAVIIFSAAEVDDRLGARVKAVMTKTKASELDVARLVKSFLPTAATTKSVAEE